MVLDIRETIYDYINRERRVEVFINFVSIFCIGHWIRCRQGILR